MEAVCAVRSYDEKYMFLDNQSIAKPSGLFSPENSENQSSCMKKNIII
jgi:hypothetical protein